VWIEQNTALSKGLASQYLDEEFRALAVPDVGQNVNVLQDENDSNGEFPLTRLITFARLPGLSTLSNASITPT